MPPAGNKSVRRWLIIFAFAVLAYGVLAYALLPLLWCHYEHQQGLASKPMITETADGIPGDPLNVGLVGDEAEVHRIMLAAGWHPADPITLRTSIAIAGSVVLNRPYEGAPVSTLFYAGRKQDFAFEKPIGSSADRRHHVRLWLVLAKGDEKAAPSGSVRPRAILASASAIIRARSPIISLRTLMRSAMPCWRTSQPADWLRRSTRFPVWGPRCLAAMAKAITILPMANCALQ